MTDVTVVAGVLAPIVKASGRIVATFERVAKIGWLAGLGIFAPILVWVWPVSAGGSVGVVLLALVLALPGAVIHLVARPWRAWPGSPCPLQVRLRLSRRLHCS